jgi:hypothetical protein
MDAVPLVADQVFRPHRRREIGPAQYKRSSLALR